MGSYAPEFTPLAEKYLQDYILSSKNIKKTGDLFEKSKKEIEKKVDGFVRRSKSTCSIFNLPFPEDIRIIIDVNNKFEVPGGHKPETNIIYYYERIFKLLDEKTNYTHAMYELTTIHEIGHMMQDKLFKKMGNFGKHIIQLDEDAYDFDKHFEAVLVKAINIVDEIIEVYGHSELKPYVSAKEIVKVSEKLLGYLKQFDAFFKKVSEDVFLLKYTPNKKTERVLIKRLIRCLKKTVNLTEKTIKLISNLKINKEVSEDEKNPVINFLKEYTEALEKILDAIKESSRLFNEKQILNSKAIHFLRNYDFKRGYEELGPILLQQFHLKRYYDYGTVTEVIDHANYGRLVPVYEHSLNKENLKEMIEFLFFTHKYVNMGERYNKVKRSVMNKMNSYLRTAKDNNKKRQKSLSMAFKSLEKPFE